MGKLEDIVLKKGDIVFYLIENDIYSTAIDIVEIQKDILDNHNIIKIQRPTQYETIYEAPKQILDQKEKEYLEAVIRPFRDRAKYIVMLMVVGCDNEFCIYIQLSDSCVNLPSFKSGTMYKGMELNKEYTLKELNLFEGENK